MEGLRHFSHAHANHICNSFRSAIFTQLQEHTGLGLVDMQLEHAEHDPLASPPHPPVTKRGRSWLAVAEPGLPAPSVPFPCPPRAGQTSCGPGEAAGGIRSIWAEGSLPGQAEPCQRSKSCAFPQRHDLLPLRMLCWADLPPASREGGFGYCCVSAMPGGHLGELGDLKMPCMEERKAALSSFGTLLAKAFTWETIAFRLLLYH